MRSALASRFFPSLTVLVPLVTLACSDAASPEPGATGGVAGAGGRPPTAGNAGAPSSAGASGSTAKGGAAGIGGKGAAGGTAGGGVGGDPQAGGSGGDATVGGAGGTSAGASGAEAGGGSSGNGTAGAAAGDGGAAGNGASGAAGQGSAGESPGGGAGGTAGSGGAPSTRKRGAVSFSQYRESVSSPIPFTNYDIQGKAVFTPPAVVDPTTTCETKVEGACSATVCTLAGAGGAAGASQTYLDAGDVVVTGMKKPVTLTYNNSKVGYTAVTSGSAFLWAGAENITIDAAGGTGVGAFNATLKAPKDLVVGSVSAAGPYTIDLDTPYKVSWNDTANTPVEVVVSSASADKTRTSRITCSFDPAASPSYVPTALLATVVKGGTGSLVVSAVNTTSVALTDADVDVRLAWPARRGAATFKGVGGDPPTDPAKCEAAGSAAAERCPGTLINAGLCASSKELCRVCIAAAAPGDCAAVASCDQACGVVTPGTSGLNKGTGATLTCSAACKANHCAQTLGKAVYPTTMAVVGSFLLLDTSKGGEVDIARLSASGGKASTLHAGGIGTQYEKLTVSAGFLYYLGSNALARIDLTTGDSTNLVSSFFGGPTDFRADASGLAYTDGSALTVAALDGSNKVTVAQAPFTAAVPDFFQGFTTNATHAYLLTRDSATTLALSRAARNAPASTNPPELVVGAIPGKSAAENLAVVDGTAFFLQGASALTIVDLSTKAITTLPLPAATYVGLVEFDKKLYIKSNGGVVRVDTITKSITGTFDVGPVGPMTVDAERVYFAAPGFGGGGDVKSFCQ